MHLTLILLNILGLDRVEDVEQLEADHGSRALAPPLPASDPPDDPLLRPSRRQLTDRGGRNNLEIRFPVC